MTESASLVVAVRRIDSRAVLPSRMTYGSAGFDVRACLLDPIVLAPGARALVPSGLALALPPGSEAQVRPRSGLALQHGVTVLNSPGTIDSDYRGELKVLLVNLGQLPVTVEHRDRIAQLVISRVVGVSWREVEELGGPPTGTAARTGGFGSTGTQ